MKTKTLRKSKRRTPTHAPTLLAVGAPTVLAMFFSRQKIKGEAIRLLIGAVLLLMAGSANALKGEKTLACVAIQWEDGRELSAEKCRNVAENVADFYNRNSRGVLKLKPLGVEVDVPYKKTTGNLGAAEAMAKRKVKADYYIIPALWKNGGNHASGKIAHVVQLTGWVVIHEVGHLLGLGHSGQYSYNKNGVPHLANYGDADSPMGNNGSKFLNGPNYHRLGWLPKDEVATYDPSVRIYEFKKVSNFKGDGLTALLIPRPNGRQTVVSYPISCDACVALYLTSGGGTQKVGLTKAEWKDNTFTGIRLKVLDFNSGKVRVEVTQELRDRDLEELADEEETSEEIFE